MNKSLSSWIAIAALGAASTGSALACTASPQLTANTVAALRTVSFSKTLALVEASKPSAAQSEEGGPRSLVGLWDVKFLDNTGQVVDEAYETFHSDGTELMVDTSAPATDNVCVGVFQQNSAGSYKLKHVSFVFDPAGNLLGTATFHTTILVDARGNTFRGNTVIDVFDTTGNVVFHTTGPVTGIRITVD